MADPVRDRSGRNYARLIKPDRVHGSLYTRLPLADGGIRLAGKQVLLVNRDQPLPTLAFLI
jgi:hypothetical protein